MEMKKDKNAVLSEEPNSDDSDLLTDITKDLKDIIKKCSDLIENIATYNTISYDDVIKYFIKSNKDSRIVKGVLLKEQKDNLFILYQIFLDKENNIVCKADQSPIGRSLKTKQLDTELIELFGTKDMVLVE
jgi:adenine C2-methylase RlmN of 23S rRNA A2503 and tRNA A37